MFKSCRDFRFFACLLAGCFLSVATGWAAPSGEAVYQQQCARCHGPAGEGTDDYPDALVGDKSIAQLTALIEKTMPEDKEAKCTGDDAKAVSAYIYDAFYSPIAQERNRPARVELSRLTVRQYQNAATDLIGNFRAASQWGEERGLKADYYNARGFRRESRLIERVDPEVKLDFGEAGPTDKFEANQFSIKWEGAVFAPDTGEYEFIVRTEHATRLYVNNNKVALIDAWVKSGNDTEYRGTIRLLGGRPYPLRLEFSKAKQGVDDKKKESKPVKASIELAWKRPFHEIETVPTRYLSTKNTAELFVLETPFPPDDRSVGYERGTAISKAWENATTDAAIELTGYVATRLGELAGVPGDKQEHEPKLKEFCHRFAERAFRRPLNDEEKRLYIDKQFAESADLLTAVKRVTLLVLKSPRFLYRELANSNDPYDVASRISFATWDSLPDQQLLKAAQENRLATKEQVAQQVERMLGDMRAQSKLREFLLRWLRVDQPPDLSKDPEKFPEFTPEVISDLRTSLELAVEDFLASNPADFRQLFTSDSIYLNGRLAKIYGAELLEDAPFQKVALQPEFRSGVISHPYLLAGFAYTSTSSPIHRGVFISRSVLGRALKPPPEAVSPLAPDLHAELTTRERVGLQTKAQACQTCHDMINPLGFALENFDALGRYRATEKERPVDATGHYLTRSGDEAKFNGAKELAAFLASTEETHTAIVQQLFQYTIKQPIRAFGPEQLPQLKNSFVENGLNLRRLLVEIIASSSVRS